MSTRYVWKRKTYESGDYVIVGSSYEGSFPYANGRYLCASVSTAPWDITVNSAELDNTDEYEELSSKIGGFGSYTATIPANHIFFAKGYTQISPGNLRELVDHVFMAVTAASVTLVGGKDGDSSNTYTLTINSGNVVELIENKNTWIMPEPSGSGNYVSASNPSAYPDDGIQGNSWYVYQGADTIDPTGVDYVSPAKSARISPYSVFATRSPTGRLLSISTKPPTPSNPSFRVLIASNASLTFAIKWL